MFAVLWTATVLGNIGTFMRDVASAWMVTELSSSPTAVALIQTAATLPVFLLAIPAGVLSDILDRRRFLIGVQVLLGAVSGTLLVLAAGLGLAGLNPERGGAAAGGQTGAFPRQHREGMNVCPERGGAVVAQGRHGLNIWTINPLIVRYCEQ